MPTVPQPYVYPIANIPGASGGFTGQMSDHLNALILQSLPGFTNPVISSDEINVVISGDVDLTTEEKMTLDGLVERAGDFFIVTTDGGVTDLGEPSAITQNAGLDSAKTITLQYKDGNGQNSNGYGETIKITAPLMPIDKTGGAFDGSGKFAFTVGASLSKGSVSILVESDALPTRSITCVWN